MNSNSFDFSSIIDRTGKDALALDGIGEFPGFSPEKPKNGFSPIPMWVADMNFETCPSVVKAIKDRAEHPIFGYFLPRKEYYERIIEWQKKRNGVEVKKENIGYHNGVLGGVATALNIFCSRGDKVLLNSPMYVGFKMTLENNGYKIINSEMKIDENGIYRMDFDDMERIIIKEKIHTAIFCSPHNPCGRVWERSELEKVATIFEKHNVNVICDEIWSDLILKGNKHITFQSISPYTREHTIALYSPSKTFNLSGIIGAYHIIYNSTLLDRIDKESSLSHYNGMNIFSMYALIGAYSEEGHAWVDALNNVLTENVNYVVSFLSSKFPSIKFSKPQGTYMIFIDISSICQKNKKTLKDIEKKAWDFGVMVQDGEMFGGKSHLRMNLALPFEMLKEAMNRLEKYVFNENENEDFKKKDENNKEEEK